MFAPASRRFSRLLMVSAASCTLLAIGGKALAADPTELLKKAEAACLDSAKTQGWRADLAKVVSSRALDSDRVEVVFDLTKDGINTARLTCPYSVKGGVVNAFTTRKAEVGSAPESGATAQAGIEVNQGKAWWLLLPLALGLGSWLWLRGRHEPTGQVYASAGLTTGAAASAWHDAEAAARDGLVEVREHADISSRVLRQFRNGEMFRITGVRRRDSSNIEWLEVSNGGWVRDGETRYDRNIVR